MEQSIFEFKNYKTYLKSWISAQPSRGRGVKSALAREIGCQSAFVSQVLGGDFHFSLEQAEAVNRFLGHGKDEAHFFLLLLQHERAGTQNLKRYFLEQLEVATQKHLTLKHRLDVKKTLSREDQSVYYSAWYYAAVHVALSIPELQTKESIARYLGLSARRVSEVLEYLMSVGLAQQAEGRLKIGTTRIHLESDSPLISKHHTNWRMKAISALEGTSDTDLHYSSVVTLSGEDMTQIKSLWIKAIENAKAIIKDSKEEKVCALSLDFFEL